MDRCAEARIERQASRWLAALHASRGSEPERVRFRAWLGADSRHAAAFEELTSAWEAVGAIAPCEAREPLALLKRRRFLIGSAASLAAVASGGYVLVAAAEDFVTKVGESRSFTLPDRSRVLLDAESHLRVRSTSAGCEAMLKRGRAHFDRGEHSTDTLVVRAADCDLQIRSGMCDVELTDSQTPRVLMLSGAATLNVGSGDGPPRSLPLSAGHMFSAASASITPVADGAIERLTAWKKGRAIFSDDTLAQAVSTMNRYDRRRVLIGDSTTPNLRVSGVFTLGNNASFVEALATMLPLEVSTSPDAFIIKSRVRPGAVSKPSQKYSEERHP